MKNTEEKEFLTAKGAKHAKKYSMEGMNRGTLDEHDEKHNF